MPQPPLVDRVGAAALGFFEFTGSLATFGFRALVDAFRPPFEFGEIARHVYQFGLRSMPLILISGFAIGVVLSMHTRATLARFGAEAMIPAGLALALIRETGPLTAGLLVSGRVGAGIGAEIGAMRVTEQIDALRTLATHPMDYLVVPRFLATVMALPLLTAESIALGILAAYTVGTAMLGIDHAYALHNMLKYTQPQHVLMGVIKAVIFGGVIALIGCYKGMNCREGAEGVGRATTEAVVYGCITILISNFFLTLFLTRLLGA